MKVLLLAAGRGTRISRYLAGNPKCTVDIGGQKLIQYTIELFHKKGITDIAMVLGYRAEVIQETLKDYEGIRYFYNPFFDVTNSIASAWFAKDFLSQYDDTLIMNADVYLEETLLDRILECHKSPVMFADGTRKEEADYKYKYENGLLVKYGKELTGSDITGEYIGIGRFSKDLMPEFMEKLDGMISYVDYIEERSPQILEEYRMRLESKVQELLGDRQLDDARIAAEITIFADKICVDEETVRLRSHILSMKETLLAGGGMGRKLDFIAQEMNREANTILSKTTDLKVSDVGINLKTDIEKVREQIQNIE